VRHALGERNCDLPTMDQRLAGRPHHHSYAYAALVDHPTAFSPPQGLWKVSLHPEAGVTQALDPGAIQYQYWSGGMHKIGQEPVFVPRPGGVEEDDGWVLQMVFDTRAIQSQLVIMDARDISAGPVATISLPHHIPLGLHGSFSPDVVLPDDQQYTSSMQRYDIKNGV
jgi:all-trans-8'-apo-beta-carotenal 15,15'-oxygenase